MEEKPLLIIVSDLHVGDGSRGDDHVFDGDQFVRFIDTLLTKPLPKTGMAELIINGDFLEFAQVEPQVYSLKSANYWCSEGESRDKLKAILKGHANIFDALRRFREPGNLVTISPGNHDVDLYWPSVQAQLIETIGPVHFEIGKKCFSRYGNRVLIGHGHMLDPANRFKHWNDPILETPTHEMRLEMCPGTLFMVKFVNWLEETYPFADNVIPITVLERILRKESKLGYLSVAWTLSKFMGRHPQLTADIEPMSVNVSKLIRDYYALDANFRETVLRMYREVHEIPSNQLCHETLTKELGTEEGVTNIIIDIILLNKPDAWMPLFNKHDASPIMALEKGSSRTMDILRSGTANEKDVLREEARKLFSEGAEIVIFGHTHQPDILEHDEKKYFNPGSWTRYLHLDKLENLCLDDLQCEEDFPYQLNYVEISNSVDGKLISQMHCFASKDGNEFKNSLLS